MITPMFTQIMKYKLLSADIEDHYMNLVVFNCKFGDNVRR